MMAARTTWVFAALAALAALAARSAPAPVAPAAGGATAAASQPAAPNPVRFGEFSPTGTVKKVRQVRARFQTPMIALGDTEARAPFDVDCSPAGQGRWVDGYNWVYDFDADLPSGVRCRFTLRRGLADLAGAPVTARGAFRFDTGGPAIVASLPMDGSTDVDEDQAFLFKLDGAVNEASIRDHVHCVVDGLAEALPVRIVRGAERDAVLAQRRRLGYAYYALLWKDANVSYARVTDARMREAEATIVVLRCARPLPPMRRSRSPGVPAWRRRTAWRRRSSSASPTRSGRRSPLASSARAPTPAPAACR